MRLRDDAMHLRTFRAEYGKKARGGLLLHTGSMLEWLAPDVLAVPWWRVIWRGSIVAGSALRVAVNVSGRHLQEASFATDVRRALEEAGLEPENLVIEQTESTIMHNTEVNLERFRELKNLGDRPASVARPPAVGESIDSPPAFV